MNSLFGAQALSERNRSMMHFHRTPEEERAYTESMRNVAPQPIPSEWTKVPLDDLIPAPKPMSIWRVFWKEMFGR